MEGIRIAAVFKVQVPELKKIIRWVTHTAQTMTGEVQKELYEAAEHLQAVLDEVTA